MKKSNNTFRFGKGNETVNVCIENTAEKNTSSGCVSSAIFNNSIDIVVNDEHLESANNRLGYITLYGKEKQPVIIISTQIYEGLRKNLDLAFAFIFHEIGHYFGGHLANMSLLEIENSKRIDYVRKGTVEPDELFADSFSAYFLGAKCVKKALTDLMLQRKAFDCYYGVLDTEESRLAQREYQLRIKAIDHPNKDLLAKIKNA